MGGPCIDRSGEAGKERGVLGLVPVRDWQRRKAKIQSSLPSKRSGIQIDVQCKVCKAWSQLSRSWLPRLDFSLTLSKRVQRTAKPHPLLLERAIPQARIEPIPHLKEKSSVRPSSRYVVAPFRRLHDWPVRDLVFQQLHLCHASCTLLSGERANVTPQAVFTCIKPSDAVGRSLALLARQTKRAPFSYL